ncbi:HD domain-containing protein [Flavobacterium lacus]|uniref:Histidine kinase/DNA gyrase B/HSP90-like ATPase n=1 Tax=Flavobacterium lacus TaxID=1353778 RepID=A0A328X3W6_9FLAO|nr:ATP-binding protein [Flavobacterium lacus]RAR50924.1 histidine kinase/DNA gyrase B/HSP90-like ATPase [Flavobacterium lacus]
MTSLEKKLKELNPNLFGKLNETKEAVKLLLNQYIKNFPDYTDHSIHHTNAVYEIVSEVLTNDEIDNLNDDEIYILSMSSYLHDIGMCIPEDKIKEIADTEELVKERELHPNVSREKYLRDIHHTLSRKFILEEWELLKIPSEKYAEAIGLVSEGHRVVDIGNPEIYKPKFSVKNGREFVCLPYLSAVLRIADELDITNIRTPSLLTKYYMPDNEKSIVEWNKHIANTLRFISENYVEFEVKCSNHSMLAALEDQFNKIGNVINYCQKVIKNISNTENRKFSLRLEQVRPKITYVDFDPKGIKYSFDVDNVINAFVGENLYNDKLTSLRELIQNSIDTCRYKKVLNPDYIPEIKLTINKESIKIEDNGLGMDEFIIKNFFGKLCSSFYQQESIKKDYDAIGQFGVGVFSYFLMADYIDIETKTEKESTLHFRLDKDPKNYFHFFKTSERNVTGTSITLNLKEEYINYNENDFIEYIKDKFRYIEFPISVISKNGTFILNSEDFEDKNLKEKLIESLMHQHKSLSNEIEIFTHNFSNENYEGSISFVYLKNLYFQKIGYLLKDDSFKFKNENNKYNHNKSIFNICQKGVLINKGSEYSIISDTYCNLNLKQKIDIQINRNNFSNESIINEIIYDIMSELLINFFGKLINEYSPIELSRITFNFIHQNRIKLEKSIYPKLFLTINDENNYYKYLSFEEFLKKDFKSIMISLNKVHTDFLNSKIENKLVIEFYDDNPNYRYRTIDLDFTFYEENNYAQILIKSDDFYYLELSKELSIPKKMEFMRNGTIFINTKNINTVIIDKYTAINTYSTEYKFEYEDYDINFNHPFVKEIFAYKEKNINQKARQIIIEIFGLLSGIYYGDSFNDEMIKLDVLQKELKSNLVINHELTKDDFPSELF